MQFCDALHRADGSSFDEKLNCQQPFIVWHRHWSKQPLMRFRLCIAAPQAAKAL
jgi:hypothetical protein